jgi:hypothetical protein
MGRRCRGTAYLRALDAEHVLDCASLKPPTDAEHPRPRYDVVQYAAGRDRRPLLAPSTLSNMHRGGSLRHGALQPNNALPTSMSVTSCGSPELWAIAGRALAGSRIRAASAAGFGAAEI